jgi:hypothetical protein
VAARLAAFEHAVLDPREGGRFYECAEDGSERDWGYVRAMDRPARLLLNVAPTSQWRFAPDPAKAKEVELTFSAESELRQGHARASRIRVASRGRGRNAGVRGLRWGLALAPEIYRAAA